MKPAVRALCLAVATVLAVTTAGCAEVPSSSAPQAIGTRRPARATEPTHADTRYGTRCAAARIPQGHRRSANRHLAARQFLTESASRSWDDAGSALLIDRVVFTETRRPDLVTVSMQADILGSLSELGVFETAEGALPDPGPIELVKTPRGWRIDRLPNGVFLDWQQFQQTYKRNTLYFTDPTGNTVVPDPRYVGGLRFRSAGHRIDEQADRRAAAEMARTVRNLLAAPLRPAWPGHPRRRQQDRGGPRLRRGPHRAGEPVDHRSAHPATACRADHLDAVPRRYQRPVRHQCGRRRPR